MEYCGDVFAVALLRCKAWMDGRGSILMSVMLRWEVHGGISNLWRHVVHVSASAVMAAFSAWMLLS